MSVDSVIQRFIQGLRERDINAIVAEFAKDFVLFGRLGPMTDEVGLQSFFSYVVRGFGNAAPLFRVEREDIVGEHAYIVWQVPGVIQFGVIAAHVQNDKIVALSGSGHAEGIVARSRHFGRFVERQNSTAGGSPTEMSQPQPEGSETRSEVQSFVPPDDVVRGDAGSATYDLTVRYLKALADGNLNEARSFYSDTCILFDEAGPATGREAALARQFASFERLGEAAARLEVERVDAVEERAFVLWNVPGHVPYGSHTLIFRDGKLSMVASAIMRNTGALGRRLGA